MDARAGDPAAPKLLCAGSLALPTLRPVRHPQPTHLLESPCLPYPLTNRTPSPLGAPTSPGRFPPHSPSPPGAPSPRTPNPLYLKVALLPPTPGHQPPATPHLGESRPRTLDSRRAEPVWDPQPLPRGRGAGPRSLSPKGLRAGPRGSPEIQGPTHSPGFWGFACQSDQKSSATTLHHVMDGITEAQRRVSSMNSSWQIPGAWQVARHSQPTKSSVGSEFTCW